MIKVLFVCLGNICRSPMAEGIFRQLVEQAGLSGQITCDSAGTSSYHIGDLPDRRMRQTSKSYGIELTHCARQLHRRDFEEFDYLVAMDESNYAHIASHTGYRSEHKDKVLLMRTHDEIPSVSNVPDPYYGQLDEFEEVYRILLHANKRFLNYLIQRHKLAE